MANEPPDPFQQHTQEGVLTEGGFMETALGSECWACGTISHKRKPGTLRDIWRCECGVEWQALAKAL